MGRKRDTEPKCPGCNEAPASYRQKRRDHLCGWCGYDHNTDQHAQLVPATTPDTGRK